MSRLLLRRSYSTAPASASAPAPSAASIAASFLSRANAAPPSTRTQLLDANQSARLSETLDRPQDLARLSDSSSSSAAAGASAAKGTPLPPTHHLVYFTPTQLPAQLGADGTDTSHNPEAPFTRRMWAGGEVRWRKENLLRVGQEVREATRVLRAEAKVTRAGEEMLVVGVEKTLENELGVSVVDTRNWIFRAAITTPAPLAPTPAPQPLPMGPYTRDFLQTPVALFRFSALTFNAHRIHYDREWCRAVEGHRELVVHGPLNLINMIDFWRDVKTGGQEGAGEMLVPRSVKYRATSPLYAGEKYRIVMEEEREAVTEARIVDSYGNVCMTGRIESY